MQATVHTNGEAAAWAPLLSSFLFTGYWDIVRARSNISIKLAKILAGVQEVNVDYCFKFPEQWRTLGISNPHVMSSSTTAARLHEPTYFKAILLSTIIAGTLDITAAIVSFMLSGGKDPIKIFYFISSGVFGKEIAYGSGGLMAVLGILFHYLIVFLFSLFMFLIYPWLKSLLKNRVLIGVLYGIFVWFVMNKIVVPLSNTPAPAAPPAIKNQVISCLILVFFIGIPIAWIADRYYSKRQI